MLMKAIIISQLTYCPLVWMFHSRNTDNRVNKIYERALKLVYIDSLYLRFDEMLIKHKLESIYQRNLRIVATEIFKVKNEVSTRLTEDIFSVCKKLLRFTKKHYAFTKKKLDSFLWSRKFSSLAPKI